MGRGRIVCTTSATFVGTPASPRKIFYFDDVHRNDAWQITSHVIAAAADEPWGHRVHILTPGEPLVNEATVSLLTKASAVSEDRTHDLRIMRPTRYQLRYHRYKGGNESCCLCFCFFL